MNKDFCKLGQAVIESEAQAILALSNRIDEAFSTACESLLACSGRIIVMGMGKSGHIGRKMAATFASTGSPAFFIHPSEACHGDFGMVTKEDVVIAISNSGDNAELLMLLPLIKRLAIPLISLTGKPTSPLAIQADIHLDISVTQEACPLNLAPTSSTTTTLVMGDALAVALLHARGFSADDFALSHPGGRLGRQLLLRIDTLCHQLDDLPLVIESATVSEAIIEITAKKLGMSCVTDKRGQLVGVVTDGDIRRAICQTVNIHQSLVKDIMTVQCQTVSIDLLAAEALNLMQRNQITTLVAVDNSHVPIGVVHMHDLVKAGVV